MQGMIESLSMRMLPLFALLTLLCMTPVTPAGAAPNQAAAASATESGMNSAAVMEQFAGDDEVAPERRIETKRKHQILFMMGISLLVLLFMTGSLGVAMVAFDKDVFVPHMIFAGLSLTLAAAHAATSIAWFWPY